MWIGFNVRKRNKSRYFKHTHTKRNWSVTGINGEMKVMRIPPDCKAMPCNYYTNIWKLYCYSILRSIWKMVLLSQLPIPPESGMCSLASENSCLPEPVHQPPSPSQKEDHPPDPDSIFYSSVFLWNSWMLKKNIKILILSYSFSINLWDAKPIKISSPSLSLLFTGTQEIDFQSSLGINKWVENIYEKG